MEDVDLIIDKMHSYLDRISALYHSGAIKALHLEDLDSCEFSLRELINDAQFSANDEGVLEGWLDTYSGSQILDSGFDS